MQVAALDGETDFEGWRKAARAFRLAGVSPERAAFRIGAGGDGLFDERLPPPSAAAAPFTVPKAFVDLAREVILHRAPDRFDLLYRLLWRLGAEPELMRIVNDVEVADAHERAKNV